MEHEGDLSVNLSDQQWGIIFGVTSLLQPFMVAQRLLEGEDKVTISLILYIIYKIRKGLHQAVTDLTSSLQVQELSIRMLMKCSNKTFGSGEQGIVATEHLTEGPRRHLKGIPKLTLIAALLDPRVNAGIGIPTRDQAWMFQHIKEEMIHAAMAQQHVPIIPPPLGRPMDNNPLVPCNQQGDPLNDLFDELEASIESMRDRIEIEGNKLGKAEQRREKAQETAYVELLLF